jgi:hypothetical protein
MKSKMFVVLDKDGKLLGASFATPPGSGIPYARPTSSNPEHTLHEIEVPNELAFSPTHEAVRATLAKFLASKKLAAK